MADRGIGGTGAPLRTADRGIGGTGAPSLLLPDGGGIGGTGAPRTGIVGVITGFASVCLAGQEVGYRPDLPILVDGQAATPDALRAGQVAVVVAEGAAGGDGGVATSLAIRHEVSGPVERVGADGIAFVAGQPVLPPFGTWLVPGSWVAVSGFRRPDGVIGATRVDPRRPGEVLVRGIMRQVDGHLVIGTLEVRPGRFQERRPGIPVVAIGRLGGAVLDADTVEADGLLADPATFFGPAVGTLLLEGYAEGGVVRFGGGLRVRGDVADGRALARFQRGPGGQFMPGAVRSGGPGSGVGPAPGGGAGFGGRRLEPAPTPNRSMDRFGRGGPFGRLGRGEGQNRRGDVGGPNTGPARLGPEGSSGGSGDGSGGGFEGGAGGGGPGGRGRSGR